jgi:hypothetical protein
MRDGSAPAAQASRPFAIGRVRHAGNQVFLAPDNFRRDLMLGLLVDATAVPQGEARIDQYWSRTLSGEGYSFTILFWFAAPSPDDVGVERGAIRDEHGRSITIIEGLVVVGAAGAELPETVRRRVHTACMSAYRDFWHADQRIDALVAAELAPLGRPGATSYALRPLPSLELLPAHINALRARPAPAPVLPDRSSVSQSKATVPASREPDPPPRQLKPMRQGCLTVSVVVLCVMTVVMVVGIFLGFR